MITSHYETIEHYDAVVVGAGIAGLEVARQLVDRDVAVVTNAPPGIGGSSCRAKGGVAASVETNDSPKLHARDTIQAGAGLSDPEAVEALVGGAERKIREMQSLGVPFDRDAEEKLDLGREAAHSRRRIVHAGGDESGEAIVRALFDATLTGSQRVELHVGEVVDICTSGDTVVGLVYRDAEETLRGIVTPNVVLATGGVGALYRRTTNPAESIGRGLALAYRAGAVLADLEFVQFHPTALDTVESPHPLLSEALRGEGARLVDESGEPFMKEYDARAELAPRDIVTRAVWREMQEGHDIYLDIAAVERFRRRFPSAAAAGDRVAGGPGYHLLPVTPAAHYHMGGVATDLEGRASVAGLWACGEVADTGVHGANRLASNSMLECLVFGERTGEAVGGSGRQVGPSAALLVKRQLERRDDAALPRSSEPPSALTGPMWEEVGIVRSGAGLQRAIRFVGAARRDLAPGTRWRDAALVAELVARSAWRREESRGGHYRRDFPQSSDQWLGRIRVHAPPESSGDPWLARPSEAHWEFGPLEGAESSVTG